MDEIKIDLSKLTIGDFLKLERVARGDADFASIVEILDKAVEGGVTHLPLTHLSKIFTALGEKIREAASPKNSD